MMAKMVLKTFVYLPLTHLMQLLAQGYLLNTEASFYEDQFTKYHMNIFVMFQYKCGKIRYF